ncbi:hypothetical protein TVAG_320220 [Trichomonas vaginalis G3]|uniref:C2 NT-type domain-containing protein n=1 Tax=Trichomonas vaginalis (strain ATCC PRA-98 / G3) TaxID=412133 RepID=A2DQH0_TRIV3|nr:C2 domain (calcium/lipid-binding domain, CaLB) family [Trichomonas vaginalis G3]EAY17427.1 hypothetical protein TVAG_320220 [Trichomonas vaginalis G3]KAI5491439.1 C2 domain (calcium/lipid-binding domain, CaLB) family [Trichomonas vaginalis G3]|eukprot:XP_001330796.1 hypothetical protein [Trichomonas vaginalis G3]
MLRNTFGFAHDNDYMPLMNGNKAYIRVESVNTGGFPVSNKTSLIACVGPRTSFMRHQAEFTPKTSPSNTWEFKYNDPSKSSFVFCLFKKHLFGGDEEIGEIELRLSGFEPNTVVRSEFTLKSPNSKMVPATAIISVHLCEDGSFPFCAPLDGKVLSNPEIQHSKTYFK